MDKVDNDESAWMYTVLNKIFLIWLTFMEIWVIKFSEEGYKIRQIFRQKSTYSSVPNRRVGQNKRAGGKILKKH